MHLLSHLVTEAMKLSCFEEDAVAIQLRGLWQESADADASGFAFTHTKLTLLQRHLIQLP